MKASLVSFALITAGLAACSSKADLPTIEQVAQAYEAHANANLSSEMGQRIEVRGWKDLTADCTPSGPQRATCVTGGPLDVVGFQGGQQLKPDPVPVPSAYDFIFEKQPTGWVPAGAQKKG
ncbi:TPA: hypothetical protein ACKP7M_000207 [Stenotrophomonas maltophilia]|uniref:hypothetical protein n=1 Tax=Stenotrophomonas TaxID=40323 RepID=UPI0013DB86FB|nr:hypothetical protein [Stenotrophomonas maltophilia]MBH1767418.1 hypothetical protein [Stenotrophomonas maltophilia]HEL4252299.1 hypothetical protein [Stenotrophomonas maltophilia]